MPAEYKSRMDKKKIQGKQEEKMDVRGKIN